MKDLDKIFTGIGIAALLFFVVWMSRNCSHRTQSTEVLRIDSSKFYEAYGKEIQRRVDSAKADQFGLDRAVISILRDSTRAESLRTVYRLTIIDSIIAREIRQGPGR